MAVPANFSTGRVTGQFIVGVVDGPDEDDEPDFIPASGVIAFTASTPYLPHPSASPNPVTMLKTTILAVLNDEGYICTPDPDDHSRPGRPGIRLVATDDPGASVEGWTWNATPQFLNVNGTVIHDAIKTFNFALPGGSTVDLTTVVKVPASQGIGTEQAAALAAAAQADAAAARQAVDTLVMRVDRGDFGGGSGSGFTPPGLQLAPEEDIPAVTCTAINIWSGPPTIEGSAGWFREKRVDAGEREPGQQQGDGKALDLTGSSYFSYPAVPAASDYANNSGRMVISDYKPGGLAQYANWLFNVEFVTSSPVVEYMLNAGTTNGRFGTVLVNGKRVDERSIKHTAEAGTGVGVKLTFPTAKERTIRVYGLNNGTGRWGGVAVAAGYTVAKPRVRPARKIAFIGDSFVNGTSAVSNTETFVWTLADLMGADEVLQAGVGGTGFASGEVDTRFANRIDSVLQYNPDVIVFAGGRNDSAAGLQSAVASTLARVAGREVYLVSTASDATQSAVNDALAAGARQAGVPFIRVDVDSLPREDAVHLNYEGHQAYAQALFTKINANKASIAPSEEVLAQYMSAPDGPVRAAIEAVIASLLPKSL